MGTNNKARRAAKAKQKARSRAHGSAPVGHRPLDPAAGGPGGPASDGGPDPASDASTGARPGRRRFGWRAADGRGPGDDLAGSGGRPGFDGLRSDGPGSGAPGSGGSGAGAPRFGDAGFDRASFERRVGFDTSGLGPDEVAHLLLLVASGVRPAGVRMLPVHALAALRSLPGPSVEREVEAGLLDQVEAVWQGGWQPAELVRQAKRSCPTAVGARLVALAVATDHAARRADTLDGRWIAQVDGLRLPKVDGEKGWAHRWAVEEGLDWPGQVLAMVQALQSVHGLPRLDPLLPPPGSAAARAATRGPSLADVMPPSGADTDPVLARIRALLAKAESTTFEAEATAFTAKAQELMTRHAIDSAMVHGLGGRGAGDEPVAIRLFVDPPYADAKSLLLQTVAEAGRCRAVYLGGLGLSTVLGYPDDLALVELLFTSLLLQAQTALAESGRSAPPGTRVRSQSFRSAFLLAYTRRIGDRLREINDAVYAAVEAEQGGAFLPVLRTRSEEVDEALHERFGQLATSTVRGGYDPAGWASGRQAADKARLNAGELPG